MSSPAPIPATERPAPRSAVGIVGAGPAGLMAAEVLAAAGIAVDVHDAMPSVGRKFLLAGKGGLNLTHGEPRPAFDDRYSSGRVPVARWLDGFGPAEIRAWAEGLGVRTFVGSSGRVFPVDMKAAPLLRAWLHRLRAAGVRFHTRSRWVGWGAPGALALRFDTRDGGIEADAAAWVLALGGASWPQLGSDAAWVPLLAQRGVEIAPLRASNCGFDVGPSPAATAHGTGWTDHFRTRFAGHPLKTVGLAVGAEGAPAFRRKGEFVVTETGIEGSLVYAAASAIRHALDAHGQAVVELDLLPDRALEFVRDELAHPRGSRSLSTHLKTRLGIDGIKAALLHELLPRSAFDDLPELARRVKALPLVLVGARPLAEAISSAGGVRFEALTDGLMLRALPGVFCAGEMIDWDAPTGGYLLSACLASGVAAAHGVLEHLASGPRRTV
jgi:uncharacterized flavoprotein (TIGR03862 family)